MVSNADRALSLKNQTWRYMFPAPPSVQPPTANGSISIMWRFCGVYDGRLSLAYFYLLNLSVLTVLTDEKYPIQEYLTVYRLGQETKHKYLRV